ncbi:MAG: phosphotransferase [Anaerolineae bacterium]
MEHELARVLSYYDLGELRTTRRIERGFVNDNWVVETGRGRYFLKRRHPDLRRPDLIRVQHDLVEWLRQAGFPAPTIVPTVSGETFLVLDGEFYEIHEYIEGQPYDHDRPAHFDEAALTLGRYHTRVKGFAPQALRNLGELYSPTILSGNLTKLTEAWGLDHDPSLAQIVGQLEVHALDLAARFAGHGALPHLVIHGDYYAGNLLFDGDCIVGVVDYDKARWQPRVVELAEALIYFASPRPGHLKHLVYPGFLDWEPFTRFLHSYACVIVPDENEVRALADYVRCIWLSISLQRLLEKGPRPAEALEALREVLALGDWAKANTRRMVRANHAAIRGHLSW